MQAADTRRRSPEVPVLPDNRPAAGMRPATWAAITGAAARPGATGAGG